MGKLLLLLVVLLAVLSFGLPILLVFAGWVFAAILALILVLWIGAALLGLVATPFVLLADIFGRSSRRNGSQTSYYPRWPLVAIPRRGDPHFDAYVRWANHWPPEPGDPTYRKPTERDEDEALPDYIGDTWEERIPERGTPEHKRYMRWANREGARDELRKSQ